MNVWEFWKEENECVKERYELSMERIRQIPEETTVCEPYRGFFQEMSRFVGMLEDLIEALRNGSLKTESLEDLQKWNYDLYGDILPEHYKESYGNPAFAAQKLGSEFGPMLSFLYTELRCGIAYAYEGRLLEITAANEVLIEIYNLFEIGRAHV